MDYAESSPSYSFTPVKVQLEDLKATKQTIEVLITRHELELEELRKTGEVIDQEIATLSTQ